MDNERSNEAINPYASPEPASVELVHADLDTELGRLQVFVGSNVKYYMNHWATLLRNRKATGGFNWIAFFFSGLWLPYRKMYKLTLIFYAIMILETVLEELVFVFMLGEPETPAIVGRAVGLVASLVCGGYANRWYLSHARRHVAEVGSSGLEGNYLAEALAKRGGTSLVASLGLFALFIIAMGMVFLPLEMLLYQA